MHVLNLRRGRRPSPGTATDHRRLKVSCRPGRPVAAAARSARKTKGGAMANGRAKEVIEALVDSVRQVIKEKNVNYDEFHAAVAFLVRLAAAGEIPLLLAVLLEAAVDEVTHAASTSSTTTIQGPFYVPGAPLLE